ncbi:MAG: DUF6252 family protein [Cyclobacteriaceae bacterium]
MKTTFYVFIVAALGFIACNNDDQIERSFLSAQLNESSWSGRSEINRDATNNDTLAILGIGNEEVLVLKVKIDQVGVYVLTGEQAIYYTTVGGDAMTSRYIVDPAHSSQVTITTYDRDRNVVEGVFEVSLIQEWSNPENDLDQLRFTNGQFAGVVAQF